MGREMGAFTPGGWKTGQLGLEPCSVIIFPLARHFTERAPSWCGFFFFFFNIVFIYLAVLGLSRSMGDLSLAAACGI